MARDHSQGSDDEPYEKVGELVRIFLRGEKWHANFQFNGRQRRIALKTTNKKEARRRAIQIEADLLSGRYAAVTKAPSLSKAITEYREFLRGKRRGAKTLAKYEYAFGLFIDLAERRRVKTIQGIDLAFVDVFRNERTRHESKERAGEKTVHNDLVLLRQIVNFALRRKMILSDPLAGLTLDKPKPRPQPCWTREEVDQILSASHEPQRGQLSLLAETGMRVGELRWLTWDDVDLKLGVLHIRPKPDGSWKPKSGDIRAIPLSVAAKEVLGRLPQHSKWVVTACASGRYPKGDHQISDRRLLQFLKRVLKRLKFVGHLHTFRHAFISHALTRGTPEAIVRQWVGHVDRDILQRYTHIADKASQDAMKSLANDPTVKLHPVTNSNKETTDVSGTDSKAAQNQHNRAAG